MKALKFLKHMKQTDTPYNFRECEINEAIEELEAIKLTRREWYQKGFNEAMKPKTCEWTYNEFDEAWDGKCGIKFVISFDTPKANNMNFCPKCGGKLIEIKPKDNA